MARRERERQAGVPDSAGFRAACPGLFAALLRVLTGPALRAVRFDAAHRSMQELCDLEAQRVYQLGKEYTEFGHVLTGTLDLLRATLYECLRGLRPPTSCWCTPVF